MRKKRAASVFLIAVFLIILYFVLFPYPLGRELVARPSWAMDLTSSSNAASIPAGAPAQDRAAPLFPFQLGGLFGYVSPQGALARAERVLFRVALSSSGFINFTRVGTDWLLMDPLGQRRLAFSGNGYPTLSDDGSRIFVVSPELTGVQEVDANGDPVWSRDLPAVMTSLSISGDYLLAGLLNGTVQLLNKRGAPVFQAALKGSRISVVYGCAVSGSGGLLASVSGIDPQRLTIFEKSGSSYSVLEKLTLDTDFRREVRVQFSPDSRYLLFESRGSVGLFDPEERRFTRLGTAGALSGAAFLGSGRIAALASTEGGRVALRVFSPFLAQISEETFPAGDLFLGTVDGQLLLGIDGRLLRVNVEAL